MIGSSGVAWHSKSTVSIRNSANPQSAFRIPQSEIEPIDVFLVKDERGA
jgi:hypothetical protein